MEIAFPESTHLVKNTNFQGMLEKLAANKAVKLGRFAKTLEDDNYTLPVLQFTTNTPKIEEPETPPDCTFIRCFAGTTCHSIPGKTHATDRVTMVAFNNLRAATVVGNCHEEEHYQERMEAGPTAKNLSISNATASKVYSALVTAAALDTVQHAILENDLEQTAKEKHAKAYFAETLSLLDDDLRFPETIGTDRAVTFAVIVVYPNRQGQKEYVVFQLGDTAIVTKSDAINGNVPAFDEPTSARWVPPGQRDNLPSINITIDAVPLDENDPILIMTNGCAPLFADADKKEEFELPDSVEDLSAALFAVANQTEYQKAAAALDDLKPGAADEGEETLAAAQKRARLTLGDDVLYVEFYPTGSAPVRTSSSTSTDVTYRHSGSGSNSHSSSTSD